MAFHRGSSKERDRFDDATPSTVLQGRIEKLATWTLAAFNPKPHAGEPKDQKGQPRLEMEALSSIGSDDVVEGGDPPSIDGEIPACSRPQAQNRRRDGFRPAFR